jgi:hypothetical protein
LLFVGARAALVAGLADCVDLVELLFDDELVGGLGGGVYDLDGGGGGVYVLGGGGGGV